MWTMCDQADLQKNPMAENAGDYLKACAKKNDGYLQVFSLNTNQRLDRIFPWDLC